MAAMPSSPAQASDAAAHHEGQRPAAGMCQIRINPADPRIGADWRCPIFGTSMPGANLRHPLMREECLSRDGRLACGTTLVVLEIAEARTYRNLLVIFGIENNIRLCFWCFLFWLGALQMGRVHGPPRSRRFTNPHNLTIRPQASISRS